MKQLADYKNPFDAVFEFQQAVCDYTGAPYCVTTDCCTHAIEIAFRLIKQKNPVSFPAKTYLSVLMTMHKLNISYTLQDQLWTKSYQFEGSNVWDCARHFEKNMYRAGTIQCISFGLTKPLQIGRGGCLLTDDPVLFEQASRMRYDGRDIFSHSPWASQKSFQVGYHYYLRPEECVTGLNLLSTQQFTPQLDSYYNYPDCREIEIYE